MTPDFSKKKNLSQGKILNLLILQKKQKPGVNYVKTGQHNKTFLPASLKLATEVCLSLLLSFREALPGWIGSSWSQNPYCRCKTGSSLPSQHWVFTGWIKNSHPARTCWWVRWVMGAGLCPLSPDNGRWGTPGEKLSPGSTLIAVGKALESHRLSVHSASSQGLLFPVGHICILTGKYSRFWIHMDMKHVNKQNRKGIKEAFWPQWKRKTMSYSDKIAQKHKYAELLCITMTK